jgi:hypothetical protein
MTDNWEDETWEDECDNVPDLFAIQEKKQKLLLEKQQMEEAENELIDDMFTGNGITKTYDYKICDAKGCDVKDCCAKEKNIKKKKETNYTVEHKRKMAELDAKKAEQEIQRKQKKLNKKEKKRQEEMYGEADPDEYDDKYGHIEEGYY